MHDRLVKRTATALSDRVAQDRQKQFEKGNPIMPDLPDPPLSTQVVPNPETLLPTPSPEPVFKTALADNPRGLLD